MGVPAHPSKGRHTQRSHHTHTCRGRECHSLPSPSAGDADPVVDSGHLEEVRPRARMHTRSPAARAGGLQLRQPRAREHDTHTQKTPAWRLPTQIMLAAGCAPERVAACLGGVLDDLVRPFRPPPPFRPCCSWQEGAAAPVRGAETAGSSQWGVGPPQGRFQLGTVTSALSQQSVSGGQRQLSNDPPFRVVRWCWQADCNGEVDFGATITCFSILYIRRALPPSTSNVKM